MVCEERRLNAADDVLMLGLAQLEGGARVQFK